jgi:predicted nucleic acid-binding protein
MAERILVDTWGWLTLHDKRERRHEELKTYCLRMEDQGIRWLTTDYILDETFTILFRRLAADRAKVATELLLEMGRKGFLTVERIGAERFEKAVQLRFKFLDKPDISFTDLSSMVVMEELKTWTIITADGHFMHAGKGFQIVPE